MLVDFGVSGCRGFGFRGFGISGVRDFGFVFGVFVGEVPFLAEYREHTQDDIGAPGDNPTQRQTSSNQFKPA